MANNLTPKEEFLLNPVTEHNITDAAIATFETNLRHGVKVEVPFAPKQDLHGYDHPWPAGGGKNLVNDSDEWTYPSSSEKWEYTKAWLKGVTRDHHVNGDYVTIYTIGANSVEFKSALGGYGLGKFAKAKPETQYVLSGEVNNASLGVSFYKSDGTYISSGSHSGGTSTLKFTTPVETEYILIIVSAYQISSNAKATNIQLELGSTATSFEPYENICPISGWTGANVEQRNGNLFNPESIAQAEYYTVNDDLVTMLRSDGRAWTELRPLLHDIPVGTYTLSVSGANNLKTIELRIFNGTTMISRVSSTNGIATFTITDKSYDIKVKFSTLDGVYPASFYVMVNPGTSVFDYSKYTGKTIPISWKHAEGTYEFSPVQEGSGDPSPENVRPINPGLTITRDDNTELTVYGGSITFNDDGTSRVENKYGIFSPDNNSNITINGRNENQIVFRFSDAGTIQQRNDAFCSHFMCIANPNISGVTALDWYNNACQLNVQYTDLNLTSVNEFKQWLTDQINANNPFHVVYRLSESTSIYTLSITETQRAIEALGDKVTTTIYGGTVTVNEDGSADVVSEIGIIDMSVPRLNYGYDNKFYIEPQGMMNYQTGMRNIVCEIYSTQPPEGVYANRDKSVWIYYNIGFHRIMIQDSDYYSGGVADTEGMREFLSGKHIAYPLATPITYHFPNVGKLKAFLGTNNIWADIGNVNVKYLTQNSETGMEYRGDRALELRRRAMIADAPTIHTTTGSEETGGLASFKSYVKAPVKKIEIPFKPKQDLHGYDHPWPAGGGENLLKLEDQEITKYTEITLEHPVPVSNGYYTLSVETTTTDTDTGLTSIVFIASSGYNYAFSQLTTGERTSKTVQFTRGDDTFVKIRLYASSGGASQGEGDVATFKNIKLEAGEVATPYSNICPIEGYDGCNVYHSNENLLSKHIEYAPSPIVGVSFVDDGNGKITFGGQTSTAAAFSKLSSYQDFKDYGIAIPPGTYKFSGLNATGVSVQLVYIGLHDTDLSKNGGFIINNQTPVNTVTFTEAKLCLTRFIINANVAVTGTFLPVLSIAEPSGDMVSALTTLPISWQTEAGTIYGGTVTIYDDGSADVEVHMSAPWVMTPSVRETVWRRNGTSNFWYNQDINVNGVIPFSGSGPQNGADLTKCVCNLGACSDNLTVSTLVSKSGYGFAAINTVLLGNTADVSPHAKYTELQSSNTPIKISLYYDTPIETYHFSNLEELKVWLGENNFWCDISDDISVKYWNRGFSN